MRFPFRFLPITMAFALTHPAYAQAPTPVPAPTPIAAPTVTTTTINGWTISQVTVKLTWNPPTTRENGQALPLAELSKYQIIRTPQEPGKGGQIRELNAKVRTIPVKSLDVKQPICTTMHYAMVAIDTKGLKSKLSEVVSHTTPCPNS